MLPSKTPVEVGIEMNQPNNKAMCQFIIFQNNDNSMIVFGSLG